MSNDREHGSEPRYRTRVAPLVPMALAMAAGIAIDRYAQPCATTGWAAIALAAAGLGLGLGRGRGDTVAIAVLMLGLGGAWHHARWSDIAADDLALSVPDTPQPAWVRGIVCEMMGIRPGDPERTRGVIELAAVADRGTWRRTHGRTLLTIEGARGDLVPGQEVEVAGSLARLAGPLNPGEFDARSYYQAQGVRLQLFVEQPGEVRIVPETGTAGAYSSWSWYGIKLLGRVRAWSRDRLLTGLDATTAPLAAALLLGQREGVDPEINDAFARTGTTHLLAISGLHLQAMAWVLWLGFRLSGLGRRGRWWPWAAPRSPTLCWSGSPRRWSDRRR